MIFTVKYGINNKNIIINDLIIKKCLNNNIIYIPVSSMVRDKLFTDPLPNVHKFIIITNNLTNETVEYNEDTIIYIDIKENKIYNSVEPIIENKINDLLTGKYGIEIGGPSNVFKNNVYKSLTSIDNLTLNTNLNIDTNNDKNKESENTFGKMIINDVTNITNISDETYDAVITSNTLGYIANPLKGLKEMLRILKKDGYIVIVVPEKSKSINNRRSISTFSHLLKQYQSNVGEDDLTTLSEFLMNYDLSYDHSLTNYNNDLGYFYKNSLDNFNTRIIQHYVYNEELLQKINLFLNCEYIFSIKSNDSHWFIMKKVE
jgi:SAM-dependent methyltransferase